MRYNYDWKITKFSGLVGKTITDIRGEVGSDSLTFTTDDGTYCMYHDQDCCESVSVEDIIGDVNDLLNTPILRAEESSNNEHPDDYKGECQDDSFTWTFYRISTIKGTVVIRWFGQSSGYYSEDVDFYKVGGDNDGKES